MIKSSKLMLWLVACLILLPSMVRAQAQVPIIPKPAHIEVGSGYFTIDEHTAIEYDQDHQQLKFAANYFANHIEDISGYTLPVGTAGEKVIKLVLTNLDSLGSEGYKLQVAPKKITIQANTKAGIFYGMQSLVQTLPAIRTNQALKIPVMHIVDEPRFEWRGFMLDVSRHFYSVETIKNIIDLMARYKMNVFHWHLTDNEGWRLEIKEYPKLTEVGAWRKEVPGSVFYHSTDTALADPYRYGGYYTQQQAREVVAYAKKRNIMVVPEIDMPGHSAAALAAYPKYSCSGRPQPVAASYSYTENNGIVNPDRISFSLCPCKESTYRFLTDVLTEVMDIFPSKYIHIGGDEVDTESWKQSRYCRQIVEEEGLRNIKELQGYFMGRIQDFLNKHGRKMIGWDEILAFNLDTSATVMSWRGEKGGIEGAKRGYDVIMAPNDRMYLNRVQADPASEPYAPKFSINTLKRVYKYNPYPEELPSNKLDHILGGQVALWTEFVSSVSHLQYMLLPRLPAAAEVFWTLPADKNFDSFVDRLQWHFISWSQQGIRFHPKYFNSRTNKWNRKELLETKQ